MRLIRGSELDSFLFCRQQWKWAWVDGIVPKTRSLPLNFGTIMHKFVEVFHVKGEVEALYAVNMMLEGADFVNHDQVKVEELMALVYGVSDHYAKHYADDPDIAEVIATELTFAIPITSDVAYTGTIDLIYLDHSGRMKFMDHKNTRSTESYVRKVEMDRQISRYWWALDQLAEGKGYILAINSTSNTKQFCSIKDTSYNITLKKPAGFVYNLIKRDYPVPPKVLKKGSLSVDKNQRTTLELYMQAIEKYSLNADDYREYLDFLSQYKDRWFKRIKVYRSDNEKQAAMEDLANTVKDMNLPFIYRNTRNCDYCAYRPLCVAAIDGANVDLIKEELYTQREAQNTMEDDEDEVSGE